MGTANIEKCSLHLASHTQIHAHIHTGLHTYTYKFTLFLTHACFIWLRRLKWVQTHNFVFDSHFRKDNTC